MDPAHCLVRQTTCASDGDTSWPEAVLTRLCLRNSRRKDGASRSTVRSCSSRVTAAHPSHAGSSWSPSSSSTQYQVPFGVGVRVVVKNVSSVDSALAAILSTGA